MPPRHALIDRRFGRLLVQSCAGRGTGNHLRWNVLCDCGETKIVYGRDLTHGKTLSCGCLQQEKSSEYNRGRGKGAVAVGDLKTCSKCGHPRPTDQFTKAASTSDRLHSWCKRCLRNANLFAKHGLTLDDYDALLRAQDGRCASCADVLDDSNKSRGAHPVDHCHATGRIRGILCHGCNTALGLLRESPERAECLIAYMRTVCTLAV